MSQICDDVFTAPEITFARNNKTKIASVPTLIFKTAFAGSGFLFGMKPIVSGRRKVLLY